MNRIIKNRIFIKLDYVIAFLLLLIGGVGSAFTYGKILEREAPLQALVPRIPSGDHRYLLFQDQGCIGTLETHMAYREGEYVFDGEGSAHLRFQGHEITPLVKITATFNSIGQMGGSYIRLSHEGFTFTLGTKELNPLKLIARAREGNVDHFRYETMIPGPVTIRENSDKSYRLEYLHFGKVAAQYKTLSDNPQLQKYTLRAEEIAPGVSLACNPSTVRSIDLTEFAGYANLWGGVR